VAKTLGISIKQRFMFGLAFSLTTSTANFATDTLLGDPARVAPLVTERCAGCHGLDGNSTTPSFPRLAGMNAKYLLNELRNYKSERRGSEMMQPMVMELSEPELLNLALYFAAQTPVPASVTRPDLLEFGKRIYFEGNEESGVPACAGCHEEDGAGTHRFPRVAGQNPEYVVEELKRYTTSKKKYRGKLMRTVAERLTPIETEAVAEFMAGMR
jgi:cytochrome c553